MAMEYTRFMAAPTITRPGRNEPCHCGSGRKYKHCCLEKDNAAAAAERVKVATDAPGTQPEAKPSPRPRVPQHQTHQPWKATASRTYIPRQRGPRKVGGS
jgi:hypothetical protein